MKIVWSPLALSDLAAIRDFIHRDDPRAAQRVGLRILEAVEHLSDHPRLGRPGRMEGTRELVISGTPYIAPYRVKDGAMEIIRIFDARRRWPDSF